MDIENSTRWHYTSLENLEFPSSQQSPMRKNRGKYSPRKPRFIRILQPVPIFLVLNLCFFAINVTAYLRIQEWVAINNLRCPIIPYFGHVLSYKHERVDVDGVNPFGGYRLTPAINNAWDSFINKGYFRATMDEVKRLGKWNGNNVELMGGGYLMSMNVYQELKCNDWLKREFRYPNSTAFNTAEEVKHLDYCLNIMRQQRMCRADVSVASWFWKDEDYTAPWPREQSTRLCTRFEKVEDWLGSRGIKEGELVVGSDGQLLRQDQIVPQVEYG